MVPLSLLSISEEVVFCCCKDAEYAALKHELACREAECAQLRGKDLGQRLLIPRNMLRHEENVFLDDVTVEEVSAELGVPVISIPQDGGALLRAMLHLTD